MSTGVDLHGNAVAVTNLILDDASNSDKFIWRPGTVIKDAQHSDRLFFFGTPLVGGNVIPGLSIATSGFGLAAPGQGGMQLDKAPAASIYYDNILPFITYSFEWKNGHLDMLVGNVFSQIWDGFGDSAVNTAPGVMRVENVDAYYSTAGSNQASLADKGTLGMVFKKANPISVSLANYAALDPLYALAISGTNDPLIDAALTLAAAASRLAEAAKWKQAGDPLVLDLGGDGLDTVGIYSGQVYFDMGHDLFAERTGWVGANDGLLALDRNGNGRIDDGSELFGTGTGSGFADLAVFDLNHDGRIDAADAVFADLRVWQDANQDGVSQAGELYSLNDEGIVSIALNAIALDGQTAEGATLRAASAFVRTDGSTSAIYEAVFEANQTITKYAGESGCRRAAAACNDNDAWREATFRFAGVTA